MGVRRAGESSWMPQVAAADALDTADADYCELVRFVDALYPPAEKSNKAKRKR